VTDRIQSLAQERGLSAREISTSLGKSHSWLSYRYRGRQAFGLDDLEAIADLLGVVVDDLLGSVVSARGEWVPPAVAELADRLIAMVLPHYSRTDLTDGERGALIRTVGEALTYVDKGIAYWKHALLAPKPRRRAKEG